MNNLITLELDNKEAIFSTFENLLAGCDPSSVNEVVSAIWEMRSKYRSIVVESSTSRIVSVLPKRSKKWKDIVGRNPNGTFKSVIANDLGEGVYDVERDNYNILCPVVDIHESLRPENFVPKIIWN